MQPLSKKRIKKRSTAFSCCFEEKKIQNFNQSTAHRWSANSQRTAVVFPNAFRQIELEEHVRARDMSLVFFGPSSSVGTGTDKAQKRNWRWLKSTFLQKEKKITTHQWSRSFQEEMAVMSGGAKRRRQLESWSVLIVEGEIPVDFKMLKFGFNKLLQILHKSDIFVFTWIPYIPKVCPNTPPPLFYAAWWSNIVAGGQWQWQFLKLTIAISNSLSFCLA